MCWRYGVTVAPWRRASSSIPAITSSFRPAILQYGDLSNLGRFQYQKEFKFDIKNMLALSFAESSNRKIVLFLLFYKGRPRWPLAKASDP